VITKEAVSDEGLFTVHRVDKSTILRFLITLDKACLSSRLSKLLAFKFRWWLLMQDQRLMSNWWFGTTSKIRYY
jgi:hypothetical protein